MWLFKISGMVISNNFVVVNSCESYVLNDISMWVLEDKIIGMCIGFNYPINELIDCNGGLLIVCTQYGGNVENNLCQLLLNSCSMNGHDIK